MSRRDRTPRGSGSRPAPDDPLRGPAAPPSGRGDDPPPALRSRVPAAPPPGRRDDPPVPLRSRLATAAVPAGALLPIRFFFGVTFVYAGLDKLLDPSFFDPASPTGIAAQLAAFARVSPLAALVKFSEPFATPIGLLMAFAEIAIGLGALTGLAYRLAALGGAAVSLLFWLTASWATTPYYYGPDLPYAAGWLVLALAGHGDLLVSRWVLRLSRPAATGARDGNRRGGPRDGWTPRPAAGWEAEGARSPSRRVLLQVGVLGAAALALGSSMLPLRMLRGSPRAGGSGSAGPSASPAASPQGTPAPGTPAPGTAGPSAPAPGGLAVARVADLAATNAVAFNVPGNAPAPLPAGDPAVIVKLQDGTFVAYDTVCTHEGCTVQWDARDRLLLCPCHGATFDPAQNAAVLAGPTRQPLASLPINVDTATGTITLRA
jgi:thiosulfate dehydrogenase [quinone] large subunit